MALAPVQTDRALHDRRWPICQDAETLSAPQSVLRF